MATEYSGTGDPARSLALLWRTQEPTSRKGKPDLTVDRIVRAAIEVADAAGLGALSMRRVADSLGVGTMSIYTYVPGKAELLDVMLDTVIGELPRPADDPGTWRDRLGRIARANWDLFHRHPWLLQIATTRPPLGPNISAKYDFELRAVDGIGLSDLEMDSVVTLVNSFVSGVARVSVDAAAAEALTGITDEQWWYAHEPILSKVMDPSRFPLASRVGQAFGEAYNAAYEPNQGFEFGLQRVLDGVDVLVRSRRDGGEYSEYSQDSQGSDGEAGGVPA